MSLLVDPCVRLEDRDAAARLYSLLLPYERLYALAPVEAPFGSVALALGTLATALRRFDEGERHLELAAMLLARGAAGDPERARALLDDALATYRELGMDSWAARGEALFQQ
jgi:hypothetical protein